VPARNRKSRYLTHQLITRKMAAADVDIYRSAAEMVKEHGAAAEAEADRAAAQCRAAGDEDTGAVWARIAKAIAGLTQPRRGPLN
jgi:hypothetical protein